MTSHQLLPRAVYDEPLETEATIFRGPESSVVRELEPPAEPQTPSGAPGRDARYRRLLLTGDVCAGALAAVAAAALGKSTHLTVQSALLAVVAPLVAKVLGLYDHDPARLRKSTLDELPTLAQFAALMSFLALISSPLVFDGILGPREAIALAVVVAGAVTAGRVVARRLGARLVSPERCLFIGPRVEANRFGEKLAHDYATNARLVAQIELHQACPGRRQRSSIAPWPMRENLCDGYEIQRVIIAPHNPPVATCSI